jgi:hypothetical protein
MCKVMKVKVDLPLRLIKHRTKETYGKVQV